MRLVRRRTQRDAALADGDTSELTRLAGDVDAIRTDEVADSALLGILALAWRLLPLTRDTGRGGWGSAVPGTGVRLRGKVLGLVGFGTIGRALAVRAMKPTAWPVNTARGGLVDTDALLAALRRGEIAGAALDVTDPEPLSSDHPLRLRADVVLTPHTGKPTVGCWSPRREVVQDVHGRRCGRGFRERGGGAAGRSRRGRVRVLFRLARRDDEDRPRGISRPRREQRMSCQSVSVVAAAALTKR